MCQEYRILGQQRLGNCKHQTENSNNSSSGCNVFTCKCDEGILQLNLPQSWQARLKAADIDSDKLWNVAGCLFWHPALRRPCGLTGETEKGWDLKMSPKTNSTVISEYLEIHTSNWYFWYKSGIYPTLQLGGMCNQYKISWSFNSVFDHPIYFILTLPWSTYYLSKFGE